MRIKRETRRPRMKLQWTKQSIRPRCVRTGLKVGIVDTGINVSSHTELKKSRRKKHSLLECTSQRNVDSFIRRDGVHTARDASTYMKNATWKRLRVTITFTSWCSWKLSIHRCDLIINNNTFGSLCNNSWKITVWKVVCLNECLYLRQSVHKD